MQLLKRMRNNALRLLYWPDDVVGWLRIPSLLLWVTGLLGIGKYTWPVASKYLKLVNLPPIEFCWIMLITGGAIYLLSTICWLWFEYMDRLSRSHNKTVAASDQWRSM